MLVFIRPVPCVRPDFLGAATCPPHDRSPGAGADALGGIVAIPHPSPYVCAGLQFQWISPAWRFPRGDFGELALIFPKSWSSLGLELGSDGMLSSRINEPWGTFLRIYYSFTIGMLNRLVWGDIALRSTLQRITIER